MIRDNLKAVITDDLPVIFGFVCLVALVLCGTPAKSAEPAPTFQVVNRCNSAPRFTVVNKCPAPTAAVVPATYAQPVYSLPSYSGQPVYGSCAGGQCQPAPQQQQTGWYPGKLLGR